MNRTPDDETTFQKTLPALRLAPMPSARLETRVAELGQRRSPRRVLALGLTLGCLAVVSGLVGCVLLPKLALAQVLEDAAQGLKAERLHTRMTLFLGKRRIVVKETWYEAGKLRSEFFSPEEHLVEIVEKEKRWIYFPHLKVATWQHYPGTAQWIAEAQKEAQAAQAAGERLLRREPGVVDEGEVVEQGHHFRRLTQITQGEGMLLLGKARAVSWVDLQQRRLTRVELQAPTAQGWETRIRLEYSDFQTPSGFYDTTFPGAKIYNLDAFGSEAGKRFAKPLAIKTFTSRTIALRDVQVNAQGDVFVLYTDGSREGTGHKEQTMISLPSDSRKALYVGTAGAMEPYMTVTNGKGRGLTVGGEIVQGACFTLAKPLTGVWTPRTFQLNFDFNEYVGKKYYTRHATFAVPTPRPKTALLPDYGDALRILSLPGGAKERFEKDRDSGRQSMAWNDRRWADLLALTEQSLKRYPDEFWPRLYQVQALRHLGRLREARAALTALLPEVGFNQEEARLEAQKLTAAEQGKPDPED